MKGRWVVLAEETSTTECGWECKGLKMLTGGLNRLPKVFCGEVARYYICFH